ncbi:MAG: tetrahydromethanopterin S-methyltransferase subunit G [Oceanicoccus sp.]|jgi:tetrahydromethanopterin S-methyltransferase subunit G
MDTQTIKQLLEQLTVKMDEIKVMKKTLKEIESDIPMELEDLMIGLKDVRGQVKDRKDEHINQIIETNDEYNEIREMIQDHAEQIANKKLELFSAATNAEREHGNIDETVVIEGAPQRLQTQREVTIYLNGKIVKLS